jgi:hypothetical protein
MTARCAVRALSARRSRQAMKAAPLRRPVRSELRRCLDRQSAEPCEVRQ